MREMRGLHAMQVCACQGVYVLCTGENICARLIIQKAIESGLSCSEPPLAIRSIRTRDKLSAFPASLKQLLTQSEDGVGMAASAHSRDQPPPPL